MRIANTQHRSLPSSSKYKNTPTSGAPKFGRYHKGIRTNSPSYHKLQLL